MFENLLINVVLPFPTAPTIQQFALIRKIDLGINDQQVQKIQKQINGYSQDIGQLQAYVQDIDTELARQTHFRDQIVPDQVTPARDSIPQESIVTGYAGIGYEYSRSDHKHPLQVSTDISKRDTGTGTNGTSITYSRVDHQRILNTDTTVANMPVKDTGTGNKGNSNYYARSNHAHPLNIDPTTANVLLVNATAAANGTSGYYCRYNHVHPQQLTYDGNITATKFIITVGLTTEVLCANGDTKAISDITGNYVDLTTNQTIIGIKTFDSFEMIYIVKSTTLIG
ncbi:MAG: hypothetical protein EZS28_012617 [Streblomastix strix]|uniref:Uncharacterized protein n=1 Tax=Streblomastix strix TaxID=222440 RepID=A0A5J4WBD6_9EUKA|nr:MAG: hypothetical protein EZS28_012617 [Streblomastix strix]